jgi:hypothetical protein
MLRNYFFLFVIKRGRGLPPRGSILQLLYEADIPLNSFRITILHPDDLTFPILPPPQCQQPTATNGGLNIGFYETSVL